MCASWCASSYAFSVTVAPLHADPFAGILAPAVLAAIIRVIVAVRPEACLRNAHAFCCLLVVEVRPNWWREAAFFVNTEAMDRSSSWCSRHGNGAKRDERGNAQEAARRHVATSLSLSPNFILFWCECP